MWCVLHLYASLIFSLTVQWNHSFHTEQVLCFHSWSVSTFSAVLFSFMFKKWCFPFWFVVAAVTTIYLCLVLCFFVKFHIGQIITSIITITAVKYCLVCMASFKMMPKFPIICSKKTTQFTLYFEFCCGFVGPNFQAYRSLWLLSLCMFARVSIPWLAFFMGYE